MLVSRAVFLATLSISVGALGHSVLAQVVDPSVFTKIEPLDEGSRVVTDSAEIRKFSEEFLGSYQKRLDLPRSRAFEYVESVFLDDSEEEPERRRSYVFCAEDHRKRLLHISRRIVKEDEVEKDERGTSKKRRRLDRVKAGSVWVEYDDGRYLTEDNREASVNRASVPRLLGYLPPEHLSLSLATGIYARPVDVEAAFKTLHKEITKLEICSNGDVVFQWIDRTLHYSLRFQKDGKLPTEFSGRMLAAEPSNKDKPVMEFIWGSTKTLWEKNEAGDYFPREINMFYHKPTKITRKDNTLRASLTFSSISSDSDEHKAILDPDLFGVLVPPLQAK